MSGPRQNGATSNVERVKLRRLSTGQGYTGLTFSTAGLVISTICDVEATATAYTAAGATTETVTTLGTYAAPTATKCRFREVDATNHPGLYEVQLANARYAVSTAKKLVLSLSGVTDLDEADYEIELWAVNPHDTVRLGLTALPNAAAEAAGGLYTRGTGAGQIKQTNNGEIDTNATRVSGTAQTARDLGASVLLSSGTGAGQVSLASGQVTVATNNDKAGYTLSSAGIQAMWDALTSALTTVGSIGKVLVDNINATISSRSTYAGGDTSGTTTLLSRIVGTLAAGTHNAQSGDAFARLGAPAGASVSADVASIKTDTGTTLPGRLPAALVSGRMDASVGAVAANAITAASIADGAIDRATFAPDTGLQTTRSATAQAGSTSTTLVLDAGASATTDFYVGEWTMLTGGTGSGQTRLCTAYNGTTKTATVTPAWAVTPDATSTFAVLGVAGIGSLSSTERNAIADALLDRTDAIEVGLTPRGQMRLVAAAEAGKASGLATTTVTLRNAVADTKNRITATVDANGNRTAVTTDVT